MYIDMSDTQSSQGCSQSNSQGVITRSQNRSTSTSAGGTPLTTPHPPPPPPPPMHRPQARGQLPGLLR